MKISKKQTQSDQLDNSESNNEEEELHDSRKKKLQGKNNNSPQKRLFKRLSKRADSMQVYDNDEE